MDYLKNGRRKTVDGRELTFIRCDRDGNEIPETVLRGLAITNPTIERIVSDVAGRLNMVSEDGYTFEDSIISG